MTGLRTEKNIYEVNIIASKSIFNKKGDDFEFPYISYNIRESLFDTEITHYYKSSRWFISTSDRTKITN